MLPGRKQSMRWSACRFLVTSVGQPARVPPVSDGGSGDKVSASQSPLSHCITLMRAEDD